MRTEKIAQPGVFVGLPVVVESLLCLNGSNEWRLDHLHLTGNPPDHPSRVIRSDVTCSATGSAR
jgi:hypothetical protein